MYRDLYPLSAICWSDHRSRKGRALRLLYQRSGGMVIFDWWATKPELAFTFISDSSGNLRCEICKKKFMEGQPVYAVWIYDIEWAHQSCVRLNKLCPTCHGRGYVGEPDLRSLFSGWIANPDKKCKDCRGKGHVRCS